MKMRTILTLLLMLALALPVLADDHFDETVTVREDNWSVTLSGLINFSGDSTGTYYTQAVYVADLNHYSAFLAAFANVSGADVNAYVEYSKDRLTWHAGTLSSGQVLDQVAAALKADTVNVVNNTEDVLYPTAVWMRFKFVGQAGSVDENTAFSWMAQLDKSYPDKAMKRSARVKDRRTI